MLEQCLMMRMYLINDSSFSLRDYLSYLASGLLLKKQNHFAVHMLWISASSMAQYVLALCSLK